MNDYQVVERPKASGKADVRFTALIETAETGKAIRLPIRQEQAHGLFKRGTFAKRGLRMRTKKDGDGVIAWCEPIAPKNGNGA